MQQWEYRSLGVVMVADGRRSWFLNGLEAASVESVSEMDVWNQCGSEGWELVAIKGETFYFKRLRQQANTEAAAE